MNSSAWEPTRDLGSGSFGIVKLFEDKSTGRKIALKQMRYDALSQLPPEERWKMKQRMMQEIKLMFELEHTNVIKAHAKPEDLVYELSECTLHVWMEYCEKGDLRQGVLNQSENCCGVPEHEVRWICQDVNNGLKFLHQRQIIHRDLKPENILLKEGHGRIICKLTDFGYAKTYTNCSKANSYVGTVQYVAPEVVEASHKHGRAVDFWSFAIVVFELVSLRRPFLHDNLNPLAPHSVIRTKADDCIHIYFDGDSPTPTYSNCLPSPNQLHSPFREELTCWLRMGFQTDPRNRGAERHESGDAVCLVKMDHVLRTRVLNVVCMTTGNVASFKILDTSQLSNLTEWIHENLKIDPADQYLVSPNGVIHRPHSHCDHLASICSLEDNCGTLYLFAASQEPSFKLVGNVSPSVNELIHKQDKGLHAFDMSRVYSHTFFELREMYRFFTRLLCGHGAILHEIESLCQKLSATVQDGSLEGQCRLASVVVEYMWKVHTSDIKQLEQLQQSQCEHLPASSIGTLLSRWKANVQELAGILENLKDVKKNLDQAQSWLKIAQEMQSAYSSNRQRFDDFRRQYVEKAKLIYVQSLVHSPIQSTAQNSNGGMYDLYMNAMAAADKIIPECLNGKNYLGLYFHLEQTNNELHNKYATVPKLVEECEKKCEAMRTGLWSLVQHRPSFRQLSQLSGRSSESSIDIHSLSSQAGVPPGHIQRGMSVSSVASSSAQQILARLKSQTSFAESFDGDSDSAEELVKSLKERVQVVVIENTKEVNQNAAALQRMNSVLSEEDKDSAAQSLQGNGEAKQENGIAQPMVDPEQSLLNFHTTMDSNASTLTGKSYSSQFED